MDRIIYLGPFNNYKKSDLINKSLDFLKANRGNSFFYILPNGNLLKKYRKYFIDNIEAAFEMNLLTFDDIVARFVEDKDYIDNAMKNLIIKNILVDLYSKGKIKYYKNHIEMDGFINSCNYIIGEIKRSLVSPDEYLSRCPNKGLYLEIGYIYEEYESLLSKIGISDREGKYFEAIENLEKKNKDLDDLKFIIIDEFYDFRPIELAILKEISKKNLDVYINMPFDMEMRSDKLKQTLEILKDLNFNIEYIEKEEQNYFEKLAFSLFGKKEDKLEVKNNLSIIQGQNRYLEIKQIFKIIKKLHSKGEKLQDISIIISNPSLIDPIHRVSSEEGIPIDIPRKTKLENLPMVNEILNILSLKLYNPSKSQIIKRVKSKYFPILNEDSEEIYEYILRRLSFKGFSDLKDLIEGNRGLDIEEEHIKYLNKIMDIIEFEINHIKDKGSINYFNNYLLNLLKEYKTVGSIFKRYEETSDYNLLQRDTNTVKKLKEIFNKMEYLDIHIEEMSLEEYRDYLLDYFKEEFIIEKPGILNGINILNPIDTRAIRKNIVFLAGLDADYPIIEDENFYINQYNYNDLREMGIDVDTHRQKLSNEELKFSSIISSVKKKLYLSYSRGEIEMSSIFLDELLSCINLDKNNNIEKIHIDMNHFIENNVENITNKRELLKFLAKENCGEKDSNTSNKLFNELEDELELINKKIEGDLYRQRNDHSRYSGLIKDEYIVKDLEDKKPERYSISYLESYGKCPYAFMLNKIFNVEELDQPLEDYNPMDIGNLYHEVLRQFYLINGEEILIYLKEGKLFEKDYEKEVKALVFKNAIGSNLNPSSKRDQIILENIIDHLIKFIKEDIKRMEKDKVYPYEFEVEFGNQTPFYIEHGNKHIPIWGRIDRIDKILGEEKYTVIDYKSSSSGIKSIVDMEKGLSFQIPIYIMSQSPRNTIAGMYGIIKDGKFEIKLGVLGESPMISKRLKGALEREEWDNFLEDIKMNVKNTIENIQKANFSVEPLECSPYCIYKDICRYEEVVEVENGD